ncbi:MULTISPECIES: ABC transporter ATP-binding protein [Sphingomonadaceae]|uniref:Sugar ABC transporter ATP-binding protein n=1 Tax=Sphingomonas bisphenolicum TaxID=296544 RepID=A0ABM7G5X2_9SPHN|nr:MULTISPECIES: ABC transporter ATP-binding protein [Sphingomonadaceae]MBA4090790.1 ATP-binding protein [Sphingobium sp.]MBZ9648741.1 ABC transporter ATP-binding protein [Sphingobium sp. 3R8]BBF71425.1 sugar ABC transporter ATP-binding protein [Sphingomonas bisphenolicum]
MIELRDVTKSYRTSTGLVTVLDKINLRVEKGEKVGILGRNGAGKSTLVRLLGGVEQPTSGKIQWDMSISWPLAFGGAFQSSLTGLDNLRFICRVYGVDYRDKIDYVDDFSELGRYLREPVKTYSSGMRARLAFAVSMVIEFDCFLIDEITAVGDQRFHEKCHVELFEKRADRAFLVVSHDNSFIRDHCNKMGVISGGRLELFDEVEAGYEYYHKVTHTH